MTIRHRPMRPKDVRECVEIVAAHPIVGPRYGSAIADLGPAWLRLLSCDGFGSATVFEEVGQAGSRMLGVGISVFVADNFLSEVKTPPFFWFGPELAKQVARDDASPLLSQRQVQEANSHGGLNLAIWHACIRSEDIDRVEVWNELMTAFLDHHSGFLLKELVAQGESAQHLEGIRNTGGFLLKSGDGCYGDFEGKDLRELVLEPHVAGLTREMALKQLGSWIGSLFLYQPPQFGFSRSEQQLLLSALPGGTDEELSDDLGISISTVKKTWRSAYDRVAACLPELIPSNSKSDGETSKRGRDKKQHLISYLREHPQELRPVSRKLLRESAPPGGRSQADRSVS
jgi:DNA-binding CsgD family transcriptional regulator